MTGQALCGGGVGDLVAEAWHFDSARRTLRRRAARLCSFGRVVVDSDGYAVTAEIGKTARMHKVSLLDLSMMVLGYGFGIRISRVESTKETCNPRVTVPGLLRFAAPKIPRADRLERREMEQTAQ